MDMAPFAPVLHGAIADRLDEDDTRRAAVAIQAALKDRGFETAILHTNANLAGIDILRARRPALVFNLVEALAGRSDKAVLALDRLEAMAIPVTGVSARAYRRTNDKLAAKQELDAAGLPTPAWSREGLGLESTAQVIVKSADEHASLGLDAASVVAAAAASAEIQRRETAHGGVFFAEAYIEGREFNLSLLDGEALPPAEIDFAGFPAGRPRIVDWEAKWEPESQAYRSTPRRFDFPAEDGPLLRELETLARTAWALFDLSGYARVDFRVDDRGRPWILEVNANPCLTPDAGFAAAAAMAGIDFGALVGRIVQAALDRASGQSEA